MQASEVQLMMIRPDLFDCQCHLRAGIPTATIDSTQELADSTGVLVRVSNTLIEVMKLANSRNGKKSGDEKCHSSAEKKI